MQHHCATRSVGTKVAGAPQAEVPNERHCFPAHHRHGVSSDGCGFLDRSQRRGPEGRGAAATVVLGMRSPPEAAIRIRGEYRPDGSKGPLRGSPWRSHRLRDGDSPRRNVGGRNGSHRVFRPRRAGPGRAGWPSYRHRELVPGRRPRALEAWRGCLRGGGTARRRAGRRRCRLGDEGGRSLGTGGAIRRRCAGASSTARRQTDSRCRCPARPFGLATTSRRTGSGRGWGLVRASRRRGTRSRAACGCRHGRS